MERQGMPLLQEFPRLCSYKFVLLKFLSHCLFVSSADGLIVFVALTSLTVQLQLTTDQAAPDVLHAKRYTRWPKK